MIVQSVANIAHQVGSSQPSRDAQSQARQLSRSETSVPTSDNENPNQKEVRRSRWQSTKTVAAPPWNLVGSGPWASRPPCPERWTAPRPAPAVPRLRSPPPPTLPGTYEEFLRGHNDLTAPARADISADNGEICNRPDGQAEVMKEDSKVPKYPWRIELQPRAAFLPGTAKGRRV